VREVIMKRHIAALVFASGANAFAITPGTDVVTLRAVHADLPRSVVAYIAKNSTVRELPSPEDVKPEAYTTRYVITRLCGAVRQDYLDEFQRLNGSTAPDLDQPLTAEQRTKITWAGCVHVEPLKAKVAVLPTDGSAWRVYNRLTGGGGNVDAVNTFFAKDIERGVVIKDVQVGQLLEAPHATAAVELRATDGEAYGFWNGLEALVGAANLEGMVRPVKDARGNVLVSTPDACEAGSTPPYPLEAVVAAYKFAARIANKHDTLRTAEVVVVDNGFFGANPKKGPGKAFNDSPFIANHFVEDRDAVIARNLEFSKRFFAINYLHGVEPGTVSGHGTHVVGIVLGGPAMRNHWLELRPDQKPWVKVTILNAGVGQSFLIRGIHTSLINTLIATPGRIVNMSVAYDRTASSDIADEFGKLIENVDNLYVVSAGNNGDNVAAEIYPAGWGGTSNARVITVAALDGKGMITQFSNFSHDSVDIAAPGCGILSWTRDAFDEVPLNGTSQAAPMVTFAASLARSMLPAQKMTAIKARLIVSGDLLHEKDIKSTAFKVKLNVPKSLYIFHDYLRLKGDDGAYLGDAQRVTGLRCDEGLAGERKLDDVWSYKRGQDKWMYYGRVNGVLKTPCKLPKNADGTISFVPRFRVKPSGEIEPITKDLGTLKLDAVDDLVVRAERRSE
jgi:hypothetical protein